MTALYVDPAIPIHTRAEMIAHVRNLGYDFSDGAFRDWVGRGFLTEADQSHRHRSGEGGSRPGLWSGHQLKLLVSLLDIRERSKVSDLSDAGRFVIYCWLYDDAIVAIPQARRALTTWVRPRTFGSAGTGRSRTQVNRQSARLVRQVSSPRSRRADRTKTAKHLAAAVYFHTDQDLTNLTERLAPLVDPDESGRVLGSRLLPAGAREVALHVEACATSAKALLTETVAITDEDFAFARTFLNTTWVEYKQEWQMLAATAEGPIPYEEPTAVYRVEVAASSLLTVLGLRLIGRRASG